MNSFDALASVFDAMELTEDAYNELLLEMEKQNENGEK
jgi:hypothetical protein